MKKLYTTLLMLVFGLATTVTAQTAAELSGKYKMACESLLNPTSSLYVLADAYNVVLTASETAEDSVYMDGFLGTAINAEMESYLIGGKYDATAKTITFTMAADQYIVETATYGIITIAEPFVLNVGTDSEGNLQLTPQNADGISFTYTQQSYYEDEEDEVFAGLLTNCTLTKSQSYAIAVEDLVGTYDLAYVGLDPATYEPYEGTTQFVIGQEEDGSLYFTGLFGLTSHIPVTYSEDGIVVDYTYDQGDGETNYLVLMGTDMQALTIKFGADNTLVLENGIYFTSPAAFAIISEGTATKNSASSIAAAPTVDAADAAIYDLSGRRVQNATRGLYIVGGQKVLVK